MLRRVHPFSKQPYLTSATPTVIATLPSLWPCGYGVGARPGDVVPYMISQILGAVLVAVIAKYLKAGVPIAVGEIKMVPALLRARLVVVGPLGSFFAQQGALSIVFGFGQVSFVGGGSF